MRPGKGCASCRERHLKCVTEPGNADCTRCLEANRECNFGPKFKFKPVSHVEGTAAGSKSRQELSYERDQVWVSTRKQFSFILEDGGGLEYGVPDEDEEMVGTQPGPMYTEEPASSNIPISGLLASTAQVDPRYNNVTVERKAGEDIPNADHSIRLEGNTGRHDHDSETPRPHRATLNSGQDFTSPATIEELSLRHDESFGTVGSPFSIGHTVGPRSRDGASPLSLPTPGSVPRPNLSRREAYLIQVFIHKLGPWIDVCDLATHFTHELPRRAMRNAMVLYAILAVTSRHLSIVNGDPDQAEAPFYHGQCLRLVIEQLSGPESLYDDNLLATVVCMRIYEEIEANSGDPLHLRGIDRLLRATPKFAHSGGLGEAACWQSLRQDIYVSMVHSVPPSFHLENFEQSSVFTFRDDAACANVVILLFAKILRLAHTHDDRDNATAWDRSAVDVEAWNDRRLRIFQPIYYEDLKLSENRPFPVVHCVSPPQVAALQYYHACKIYLLLHRPSDQQLSHFHAAKTRRALERDVSYHLAAIVGLAESNPFVENANFTAHHLLRVGGYCITHAIQRTRAVEFLEHVERVMGWNTSATIGLLREQWSDLDSPMD